MHRREGSGEEDLGRRESEEKIQVGGEERLWGEKDVPRHGRTSAKSAVNKCWTLVRRSLFPHQAWVLPDWVQLGTPGYTWAHLDRRRINP